MLGIVLFVFNNNIRYFVILFVLSLSIRNEENI